MTDFQVPDPILNSPFEEPTAYWRVIEGELPVQMPGRRPSYYLWRDPKAVPERRGDSQAGTVIELKLVNRIRERVRQWRAEGYPGASRVTRELLAWWGREGRKTPLFFAQREAAETIIFLVEARPDFLQGIEIPRDEPDEGKRAEGYRAFLRYANKMATGAGKTTVMAMVAAWSILNKVADPRDARFSDTVLVVCPNVTIRDRLRELDPREGESSVYRTRDLVPEDLMEDLQRSRVLVTNWQVFEPRSPQTGGSSSRVDRRGKRVEKTETIVIGPKTTTARGTRYLTLEDYEKQVAAGLLTVVENGEEFDRTGGLRRVRVTSVRYVESDTALVNRVLGREVGGKRNILVMNDEAHHAYRLNRPDPDADEDDLFGEDEEAEEFYREATLWVDGLDKIHKARRINFCLDLSATPYYLGRVGPAANRPFPWIVSDFGLVDAIESGLVKIPQLAVRDNTGAAIPGYFNIWRWILPQLTPAERGGAKSSPKPEAILKYAHHPIAMLASLWERERREWETNADDPRPPVFIVVCKNTQIARVVYDWLAEDKAPAGIPPAKIEGFRNRDGRRNTIRVDSKVVHETDSGEAKEDESRWMRFTLDTVGKTSWPADSQGSPLYPEGFAELAQKLNRPLHPPGRDVRCIVSVGMLTEGWDCNTVTHIVGLRPFMSQLLCEQVVGRGLRRRYYELNADGKFAEEIAKVFGVPFEVIPFKANPTGATVRPVDRHYVHALPERAAFEIKFPRVEGYTQEIRNRITVDWDKIAPLRLDPENIPPEVQMKAGIPSNAGRPSLFGPGKIAEVDLDPYRAGKRAQELAFDLALTLTREYDRQRPCTIPPHVLFPQLAAIVQQYLDEKVETPPPTNLLDVFLSPYYQLVVERLAENVKPDASQGEAPEIPRYESRRGPGSTAEVAFWTRRDVREVLHSHVNFVVADTEKWEQSAAYVIDTHPAVFSFVKNEGLGFAIPYLNNGQMHDYLPDFLIRLQSDAASHLILETKGYDPLKGLKSAAAERWVAAVNAEGSYGRWQYALAEKIGDIERLISVAAKNLP